MIRKLMVICCLIFLFLFVSNLNVAKADTASFRIYENDKSYHRRIIENNNCYNSRYDGIYQENEIANLYKFDTATLSGQCVSSSSSTFSVFLFQGENYDDNN